MKSKLSLLIALFSVSLICCVVHGMDFERNKKLELLPPIITVITKDGKQFVVHERLLEFSIILKSMLGSERSTFSEDEKTYLSIDNDQISKNFKLLAPLLSSQQEQEEKEPEIESKQSKKRGIWYLPINELQFLIKTILLVLVRKMIN